MGVLKDFLKWEFVKRSMVEKRNLELFLWSVMSFEKWAVLAFFTALLYFLSESCSISR